MRNNEWGTNILLKLWEAAIVGPILIYAFKLGLIPVSLVVISFLLTIPCAVYFYFYPPKRVKKKIVYAILAFIPCICVNILNLLVTFIPSVTAVVNYILGICVLPLVLQTLCVILAVAFFTLAERKVLGYVQARKGPNKPRMVGVMIPFADAAKLASKEARTPHRVNLIFYVTPGFILFIPMLL